MPKNQCRARRPVPPSEVADFVEYICARLGVPHQILSERVGGWSWISSSFDFVLLFYFLLFYLQPPLVADHGP
jgi:hypothetical protein